MINKLCSILLVLSSALISSAEAAHYQPTIYQPPSELSLSTGYTAIGAGVAGGGMIVEGWTHGVLWSYETGEVRMMNPQGYQGSRVEAVNEEMQVGSGGKPNYSGDHALLWYGSTDTAVDLHPTTGEYLDTVALGLSGTHQVGAGHSIDYNAHAMLWSGTSDSFVDLHPSWLQQSVAYGVSGGEQVGFGISETGERAMLWRGTADSAVDLTPSWCRQGRAMATDGIHQVGCAAGGDGFNMWSHALVWNGSADDVIDLHPQGYQFSAALGILGDIQVGCAFLPQKIDPRGAPSRAMVWFGSADNYIDLQETLPASYMESCAYGVDRQGFIYGTAIDSSTRQPHLVVWQPVPEPAASTTIISGLATLLILRRRKSS